MKRTWIIANEAAHSRLDVIAAKTLGLTRSRTEKLIVQGSVKLNGEPARPSSIVSVGDKVEAVVSVNQTARPILDLPIIYEDDDLLVIDKPAGLSSQPTPGRPELPSVTDFTRTRVNDPASPDRPGLVHRLDRNTSGLMIIAKHPRAKSFLQRQFRDHTVMKTYTALVVGHLKLPEAEIRLPVGRGQSSPLYQTVKLGGKAAITRYRAEQEYSNSTLLLAWPLTGRTHQIRVHFRHLGHPLVGDRHYGAPPAPGLNRHFLHASAVQFTAPNGQRLELASPLPAELRNWLARQV